MIPRNTANVAVFPPAFPSRGCWFPFLVTWDRLFFNVSSPPATISFFFSPLLYNLFSPICFPWEREKWGNLAGPRGHAFMESENSSFCNRCIIFWLLGMQTGRESLERRRGARGIWLPTPLYASLHWVLVLTQLLLSVHHNIYKYIIAVENILVTSSDAGFIFPSRFLQIAGYVKVKLFFWVGHISWVWFKPPGCMIIVAR